MQTHLPQLLRNAAGLQDLIDGKRLLNELIDLHQLTMELLAEARENDRPTVALKAITVARGNIALMLKAVLPRAERREDIRRFDELYGNPLDALLRQADAAD